MSMSLLFGLHLLCLQRCIYSVVIHSADASHTICMTQCFIFCLVSLLQVVFGCQCLLSPSLVLCIGWPSMASDGSSHRSWSGSNDSIIAAEVHVNQDTPLYGSHTSIGTGDVGDPADLSIYAVSVSMLSGYVFQVSVFPGMTCRELYYAVQMHFYFSPVWLRMRHLHWYLVTAGNWIIWNNHSYVDWVAPGSMLNLLFG